MVVDDEESVHYGERGRAFDRNTRFIRSASNPRFFRQARSQSWKNARSQSRSRPSQKFQKIPGTEYWNNRDDKKGGYQREDRIEIILKNVKKIAENYENLSKKVDNIEEKMKSVNYC